MNIAFVLLAAILAQGPAGGSLRPAFDLITAAKLADVARGVSLRLAAPRLTPPIAAVIPR